MTSRIRQVDIRAIALLLLLPLSAVQALADIADRDRFDRVMVAGMTLTTNARDAFNRLKAQGFDTGDLDTYEDWWQSGLIAVKGDRNAPDGHFEIVLTRNGDTLVEIREHRIRLATPFDVVTEMDGARSNFGLAPDAADCKTSANLKNGSCGVEDPDKTAVYLLTFVGDRQRYSVVQRLDLKPEEQEGPRPSASRRSRPPPDLSGLTFLDRPPPTDPAIEPCSLDGMSAALNPLDPGHGPELDALRTAFLARHRVSAGETPPSYRANRMMLNAFLPGGGSGAVSSNGVVFCTSPFGVSDVEWMEEQDRVSVIPRADQVTDELMSGAIDYTGFSEAEIRAILDGNPPSNVAATRVRRLYDYMKEAGQSALAPDVGQPTLVFWLFSPNLATERLGFWGGTQSLNNAAHVINRHGEHFGWRSTAGGNLVVGVDAPVVDGTVHLEPGGSYRAFAYATIPDDHAIPAMPFPVPLTQNEMFTAEVGDFATYTCNGEDKTVFIGMQQRVTGYMEGRLRVRIDWDPESDNVIVFLQLIGVDPTTHHGYIEVTEYTVRETGDPDCPYIPETSEHIEYEKLLLDEVIRIPNAPAFRSLPGALGRTLRVQPAPTATP